MSVDEARRVIVAAIRERQRLQAHLDARWDDVDERRATWALIEEQTARIGKATREVQQAITQESAR